MVLDRFKSWTCFMQPIRNTPSNTMFKACTNLVKGSFKVSDIQGIKGEQFVVYEHFSKEVKVVSINEPIAN
jgi:hypothetical protein